MKFRAPRFLTYGLLIIATVAVFGCASSQTKQAAQAQALPHAMTKKLSHGEQEKVIKSLPQEYQDFLEAVGPIITSEELDVFLQLKENYRRDEFMDKFWRRRSYDGQGFVTNFKQVYLDRYAYVKQMFRNTHSDAARLVLILGPPDMGIVKIECDWYYVPIQIWWYSRIERLKQDRMALVFYQPLGMGEWKLWNPIEGEKVLVSNSGMLQQGGAGGFNEQPNQQALYERCPQWRDLQEGLAKMRYTFGDHFLSPELPKLFEPPSVKVEGVDRILELSTNLSSNSTPLTLEGKPQIELSYDPTGSGKVRADISFGVKRDSLKVRELSDQKYYDLTVVVELLKGGEGRLYQNFTTLFAFSASTPGDTAYPMLSASLKPFEMAYHYIIKVADKNGTGEARFEGDFSVTEDTLRQKTPDVKATPTELLLGTQPGIVPGAESTAANSAPVSTPNPVAVAPNATVTVDLVLPKTNTEERKAMTVPAVSIVPPSEDTLTGMQHFNVRTTDAVKVVEIYVDGKKISQINRPPFGADIDMGNTPQKRTLRVVGYSTPGSPPENPVGEDQFIVNQGAHSFNIHIMTPATGQRVSGPTTVNIGVNLQSARQELASISLYLEDKLILKTEHPKSLIWNTTVNIDKPAFTYLKAVATLADGTVTEDVRYVNSPGYVEGIEVNAVELFATVTESNRPFGGLSAKDFTVYENGKKQEIQSVEVVENVPLYVGIAIDTSGSMIEAMNTSLQSAASFIKSVIKAKDRAFTMGFSDAPYLLHPLSASRDELTTSLSWLQAQGGTALYDAVVAGLYELKDVRRGRKALVLLTDGEDTTSKLYTMAKAVEYAQHEGVVIYTIGLGTSSLPAKSFLSRLADVSGGKYYSIKSVKELAPLYEEIARDLRSQYMITYFSNSTATGWRKVKVDVRADGKSDIKVRTIPGYYP